LSSLRVSDVPNWRRRLRTSQYSRALARALRRSGRPDGGPGHHARNDRGQPSPTGRAAASGGGEGAMIRVMLVDDEQAARERLRQMLGPIPGVVIAGYLGAVPVRPGLARLPRAVDIGKKVQQCRVDAVRHHTWSQ